MLIPPRLRSAAVAWFFFAIGCYTMLAPIDGPLPIGAPALPRSAAIVLAASIVLAGIVAALSLVGANAPRNGTRAVAGWWLAALAVPAAASVLPGRSWSFFGLALLSAGVAAVLSDRTGRSDDVRAVLGTYLVGGFALVVIALAMLVTHRPSAVYAANLGRATGLFVTPNQFAAWLVPYAATATGIALAARGRALRIFAGAAAALAALTLAATYSLGGWLGGAAAVVAACLMLRRPIAAAAIAVAAVGVAAAALASPAVLHHRQSEQFVRLDALRSGLALAARFPLTGVGPLAYPRLYPLVRVPGSTEDANIGEHPHNVIVSLAAETGLVGLAAIVAGWRRAIIAIRRGFHRAGRRRRILAACIAAGLIGRFVHGAVDLVGALELAFVWLPFSALLIALVREPEAE